MEYFRINRLTQQLFQNTATGSSLRKQLVSWLKVQLFKLVPSYSFISFVALCLVAFLALFVSTPGFGSYQASNEWQEASKTAHFQIDHIYPINNLAFEEDIIQERLDNTEAHRLVQTAKLLPARSNESLLSFRPITSLQADNGIDNKVKKSLVQMVYPVNNSLITSRFGWRHGRPHNGTDFAAPIGTNIYAVAPGKIIEADWDSGYGKSITIDHGKGIISRYAHCSTLLVVEGETVSQGQLLGKIGMTGNTTGPHLHFEVLANDIPQNPEIFLIH